MDNTCKVVLCVLGRERPGFDQQWAQKMTAGAVSYLSEQANTPPLSDAQLPARGLTSLPRPARPRYSFTNYHDTLRTPAQAAAALRSPEVCGADVLVMLQPSIADGRLIDALSLAPAELPMIFWATPERGNTEQISSNSLVGTHLFAATLRQYGRRHGFVYGPPDSPDLRRDLTAAIAVAYTVRTIRRARVGLVGDHAPGFIDLHVDPRFMHRRIGTAVEHIAFEQFTTLVRELRGRPSDHPALENQSLDDIAETLRALELPQKDIADQQDMFFQQAVFTAAYQYVYSNRTLDAIAVRCWPEVPALFGQWPYFAISYLQSIGMPIAIEGDIDGAIDMLITLRLGHGNCYLTDWLSHTQRTATLWHGGAIPLQLCLPHAHAPTSPSSPAPPPAGPVITTHFNNRLPAVIAGTVHPDGMPVTLFRHWYCDGTYYCTALEAHTTAPPQPLLGTVCQIEIDGTRGGGDITKWFRSMLRHGMPHHLTLVPTHIADELAEISYHLGWQYLPSLS